MQHGHNVFGYDSAEVPLGLDCALTNEIPLSEEETRLSRHLSTRQNTPTTQFCMFYSKYGRCKYGKNCKFVHCRGNDAINAPSRKKKYLSSVIFDGNYVPPLDPITLPTEQFSVKSANGLDDPLLVAPVSQFCSWPGDKIENRNYLHGNRKFNELIPNSHTKSFYPRPSCRYYKQGFCRKGEQCNFFHSRPNCNSNTPEINESLENSLNNVAEHVFDMREQFLESSIVSDIHQDILICHYFKKGFCRNGDHCKFYHQSDGNTASEICGINGSISETQTKISQENSERCDSNFSQTHLNVKKEPLEHTILNMRHAYNLSVLDKNDLFKLRNTEIIQLKKRFPNYKVCIENSKEMFLFDFHPSDPDWPFDLKSLDVEVFFPESYPKEICKISVSKTCNYIPDMLVSFLNESIKEWLVKKYEESVTSKQIELYFRPFLKWFDKSLEELFLIGLRKVKVDVKAKSDGIEFIPFEKLLISHKVTTDEKMSETKKIETQSDAEGNNDCSLFDEEYKKMNETLVTKEHAPALVNENKKVSSNTGNHGTKVTLTDMELTEGTAAMTCTKISSTLQCSRCRTNCNIVMSSKKNAAHKCPKCHKTMGFMFEPSILHQFSNLLGHLQLSDCQAVDVNLIECNFLVDCLNCSKQVSLSGIHYGQKYTTWCTFCNQKLNIFIGSVKFLASKQSYSAGKYPNLPVKKKKSRDPIIQEGENLPDFGACKHYKKSYRWLRFPCCGKIYPCDICHNDKEADHEMKFASRMICGFCSKEQPYSREKPCNTCSSSMTKKSGSHWEGGKGCRNRIQMCREDKQKYSGASKTISRKALCVKTGKKK